MKYARIDFKVLFINILLICIAIYPYTMARPQTPNPRAPQFGIAIPNYVLIQLRAMAVREQCSLRHLVLKALPALGIHVDPLDLQLDERKGRPKGTRTHYATKPAKNS
jgi:hypothetical protein